MSGNAAVGFSLLFVGVRDVQWSFQVSKTKCYVADTASVTLPVPLLSLAKLPGTVCDGKNTAGQGGSGEL